MSDKLLAILFNHECEPNLTINSKLIARKETNGEVGLKRLVFADKFAGDNGVIHGHVAFVEINDQLECVDKITISRGY